MAPPPVLVLHGLHGSSPDHWQRWLAERLRAHGRHVAFPDLPDPDTPELAAWLDALARELAALPAPPVVACQSLGCLLWLHHVARGGAAAVRTLLVAPPSAGAGLPELAGFLPAPLPALPNPSRLVCSDDDPYCPEGAAELYGAPLGIPVDLLPGRGHLNPDAGYGPWPSVEAWCLADGNSPVTA